MNMFTLHCDREWRKVVIEETHDFWSSYLEVTVDFDVSTHVVKKYNYRIMCSMDDLLARWTSKPEDYMCHESINAARMWLDRMISMDRLMVLNIGYHRPQFQAMHLASAQICMPTAFKSDMYWHDALLVARHNPPTFLWYVRNAGSWLILPENYGGTLHHHIKDGRYEEQVCYLWDSDTLREVK